MNFEQYSTSDFFIIGLYDSIQRTSDKTFQKWTN